MAFATGTAPNAAYTTYTSAGFGGRIGNLTPVVNRPVLNTPAANWNLVDGLFTATGNETQLFIGNFDPGYSPGYTPPYTVLPAASLPNPNNSTLPNLAYYFIDEVVLQAVPTAGPNRYVTCGQRVTLGDVCDLPTSSGATYAWTFPGGAPATGLSNNFIVNPQLSIGPNFQTIRYVLTVTLPNGQTQASTVTLTPDPIQQAFLITASSAGPYCAGSTLTLSVTDAIDDIYTWTSNPAGFTATGNSVTITMPAGTIKYTVTSACRSASIVLTVDPDCCLRDLYNLSGRPIIDISGPYYNNPFTNVPPGVVYHVTGPITLFDDYYELQPGTVVYIEPNCPIRVDDGAALGLHGAKLTAACGDMWDGVYISALAYGIETTDPKVLTSFSQIEHSLNGIVLEEPDPTRNRPYFRIRNVDFRQNFHSISINRLATAAGSDDWVRSCTFDSDPSYFKMPHKGLGEYSMSHIQLQGDVRAGIWNNNTFEHAMVGLFIPQLNGLTPPVGLPHGWFDLEHNRFSNCFVAGIGMDELSGGTPPSGPASRLYHNYFTLPNEPQPGALQRATNATNAPYWDQCHGAMLRDNAVDAFDNTFTQPQAVVCPNYDFKGCRGIEENGLRTDLLGTAQDNRFEHLAQGLIAHLNHDTHASVWANTFTDCQRGLVTGSTYDNSPGNAPVLYTTCNTFARDAARPGLAKGIVIEPGSPTFPNLQLDDYSNLSPPFPTPKTILKDLFLPQPYGRPMSEFIAIDNTSGVPIRYNTFKNQAAPVSTSSVSYLPYVTATGPNAVLVRNGGALIASTNPSDAPFYPCRLIGAFDFPLTGIQQRPAGAPPVAVVGRASIGQNIPNPCTGSTTLAYQLPATAKQAHVIVRRGMDGLEIEQVALKTTATEYLLNLRHYAPGLYFYTLVVDGVPAQTQRMLVE